MHAPRKESNVSPMNAVLLARVLFAAWDRCALLGASRSALFPRSIPRQADPTRAAPVVGHAESPLVRNPPHASLASHQQLKRAAQVMEADSIEVIIAMSADKAQQKRFDLHPPGAGLFTASPTTLDTLGDPAEADQH